MLLLLLLLLALSSLTSGGPYAPGSGGGVYNDYTAKDVPRLDQPPVKILISSLPTEDHLDTHANSTDPSPYLPPYEFPYANATGNLTDPLLNSSSSTRKDDFQEERPRPTDSEVPDLLDVPTERPAVKDLAPNPPHIIYDDVHRIDDEVEQIDEGPVAEEDLRAEPPDDREQGIALVQGQMAAILAGIFVAVAVIGYVGLMTWRRYLENRYSGREMLVNEFEYNARDENLKYFSI